MVKTNDRDSEDIFIINSANNSQSSSSIILKVNVIVNENGSVIGMRNDLSLLSPVLLGFGICKITKLK